MDLRPFGNSGLMTSPVGLGCYSMSGSYGPSDDAESIATIHRAIELGVTFFDTSTSYGMGHNQELIGRALKGRKGNLVVHSKFGVRRDASGHSIGSSASPETVRADCEASLRRFGFETIDIWCPSRVDPDVPIEDTIGAMAELKREGKIRYLGLSEAAPETLRRAQAVHPIASLQMEYSLFARDAEGGNIAACRDLGIAFMAYSPIARGLLSGQVRGAADLFGDTDARKSTPWFDAEHLERNVALLAPVEALARDKGATPAQIALAWVMAKGPGIFPIPGSSRRAHLEENLAALDIALNAAEIAGLDSAFAPDRPSGRRYRDDHMNRVNR